MMNDNENSKATSEKTEAERIEVIMNFDELDDGSDPNADLDLLLDTMQTIKMKSESVLQCNMETAENPEQPIATDDEPLSSFSWIRESLREEAMAVSSQHLDILSAFERDQPKLWSATLHLIHDLILEELGIHATQHSEFEKQFKGCLVKLELEINCNLLPTIYYFEEKTSTPYAWALMDLNFVDQKKIEDYVFFKHLLEDESSASQQFSEIGDDLLDAKFQENLVKSFQRVSENPDDPLVQSIVSNFREKQKKLENLSEIKEFYEFMGFDKDEKDLEESDISFMEIAVMLSQKVLFNLYRLALKLFS